MKIQNHNVQTDNPLGSAPVGGLILKFSVPAIISMLVSALYNIVDQIFIGQGVGMLGNAATNVAFPVTIFSTAIALLLGIGGASSYNLESGAGHDEKASYIAGASLSMLGISGILISAAVLLFLDPLLHLFGGTPDVMPYAIDYTGITAVGIPFYILTTGGCHLIRADRSPGFSMTCMLTGAVINTVLDPLFIFGFGWGIKGGAWATVIGQAVSGILVILYFARFRKMNLNKNMFLPHTEHIKLIVSLGAASFFNQIALAVVQIFMNNILRYYGAASAYGSDIPIACVGIISKVNMVFLSICIGISQGSQPIWGFNYGAGKYDRVEKNLSLFRNCLYHYRNCIFSLFSVFPSPDCRTFRNRKRSVLSVCRTLSSDFYVSDLCQRHTAHVCRIFYLHRRSKTWNYHVPYQTACFSASPDRDPASLYRNRRRHVCRSHRRYSRLYSGYCLCQKRTG